MKKEHSQMVMGYWKYATLEELHHRSLAWLSEIAFWKDEIYFMQKLVSDHFTYFTDKKYVKNTLSLVDEIRELDSKLKRLEGNVEDHEKRLKAVLQQQGEKHEEDYRQEHGMLEAKLDQYIQKYKSVKKALFLEADNVLKSEKMEHLISLAG